MPRYASTATSRTGSEGRVAGDKAGFDDWCMWTGYETGNPPSANRYWDPYVITKDTPARTYEGVFGPVSREQIAAAIVAGKV